MNRLVSSSIISFVFSPGFAKQEGQQAAAAQEIQPEAVKAEVEKLQGVWQVRASAGGKDEKIQDITQLTIRGDTWRFRCGNETAGFIARLNPTASPKAVDLVVGGTTAVRGIYFIKDDRLTLTWYVDRQRERPRKLTFGEGLDTVAYGFEREEQIQTGYEAPRKPAALKREKVRELMQQFRDYYKVGKYAEAENTAKKAIELDPDNPAIEAALAVARLRASPTVTAKNEMFPDGREHDFGWLVRGTLAEHEFTLVNTSKAVLEIPAPRVSAGCLTVRMPKTVLQPGEKTKLMIELDTSRFIGPKTISVFLQTAEPYLFTIKAESVPAQKRDPAEPVTSVLQQRIRELEEEIRVLNDTVSKLKKQGTK